MNIVEVNGLCVDLGNRTIIKNANLKINKGITVLLGRNGCGKSTLIRAIMGLIPSSGSIKLEGKEISRMSARKRAVVFSYLPQSQAVPSGLSVIDYVSMGFGSIFSPPGKNGMDKAMTELCRLNIESLAYRRLDTLSGGELKLAGLARTRVQQNAIALMDEPLAGLDFARQHEFMDILKHDNRSVFMSMHDPMLAWQYADSIILVDKQQTFSCEKGDESNFQQHLNNIYGKHLRFEQAGNIRVPMWHNN